MIGCDRYRCDKERVIMGHERLKRIESEPYEPIALKVARLERIEAKYNELILEDADRRGVNKMSEFKHIADKAPATAMQWFTCLLTVPAMLWIGAVLWVFDREDYHRMRRWCFEERHVLPSPLPSSDECASPSNPRLTQHQSYTTVKKR